jgi:carbamoyltransferase
MIVDGVGSYRSDVMEAFPASDTATPLARESESYYKFSGTTLECLKKVWMEPDRGFPQRRVLHHARPRRALQPRLDLHLRRLEQVRRADGAGALWPPRPGQASARTERRQAARAALGRRVQAALSCSTASNWEKQPCDAALGDLAWRTQDDTENVLLGAHRWLRETTGAKNLCMAGGVALNCVANGRVAREGGFENVWIQPRPATTASRSAAPITAGSKILKQRRDFVMDHSYVGRRYSDQEVGTSCRNSWCASRSTPCAARICRDTAKLLADQKVIGWFQDRSEFGRARSATAA